MATVIQNSGRYQEIINVVSDLINKKYYWKLVPDLLKIVAGYLDSEHYYILRQLNPKMYAVKDYLKVQPKYESQMTVILGKHVLNLMSIIVKNFRSEKCLTEELKNHYITEVYNLYINYTIEFLDLASDSFETLTIHANTIPVTITGKFKKSNKFKKIDLTSKECHLEFRWGSEVLLKFEDAEYQIERSYLSPSFNLLLSFSETSRGFTNEIIKREIK